LTVLELKIKIKKMITQELIAYIKTELAKGTPKDVIQSNLVSGGWDAKDVAEGFAALVPKQAPAPMPAPVQNPTQSVSQPVQFTAPVQNPVQPVTPMQNPVQPVVAPAQNITRPAQPLTLNISAMENPVQPMTPKVAPVQSPVQPVAPKMMPVQNQFQPATPKATPVMNYHIDTHQKKPGSPLGMIILIFLILGGGAYAYYKYFYANKNLQIQTNQNSTTTQDTNIPVSSDNSIQSTTTANTSINIILSASTTDCGTSVDSSKLPKIVYSTGTSKFTFTDLSKNKALVCMGNNLLNNCQPSKVQISATNPSGIEIIGGNDKSCLLNMTFNKNSAHDDLNIKCEFLNKDIVNSGCSIPFFDKNTCDALNLKNSPAYVFTNIMTNIISGSGAWGPIDAKCSGNIIDGLNAFPDKLISCTPYKTYYVNPLTSDVLSKQILGVVNSKCIVTENMPNNGLQTCKFTESMRNAVAQYEKDLQSNADMETKFYVVDGKKVQNPLDEASNDGSCIISGY
jgi:hypothetical protein